MTNAWTKTLDSLGTHPIHTGRWFDQENCQQAKSIKVEKNNDIDQGCWS